MTTETETPALTTETLAQALLGHYNPEPATVDAETRGRLSKLIGSKGFTLTGLARAMGKSHTWILRKLDPDQPNPRPCTLEDVAAILSFLGATPADLTAAA